MILQVKLFVLPALAAEEGVNVVDLLGVDEVREAVNDANRKWLLFSFLRIGENSLGRQSVLNQCRAEF